ncbi:hypothetical protein QBC45DRAFT_108300 [Copromyces sp. CBS 386.78]|nr:hypothetical protein QBC45DRAFT_108300 [Copromyces sp. CBS 386.78]
MITYDPRKSLACKTFQVLKALVLFVSFILPFHVLWAAKGVLIFPLICRTSNTPTRRFPGVQFKVFDVFSGHYETSSKIPWRMKATTTIDGLVRGMTEYLHRTRSNR